jgi:hypothetical protein
VSDGVVRQPARLTGRAVFGQCLIDLQDASLHSRVTVRRPRWRDGVRRLVEEQLDRYRR